MYLALLAWLIVSSILEATIKDKYRIFYKIGFFWMTFMVCFRFGQGTDYTGYFWNYLFGDQHSEFLYLKIQDLFHYCNLTFEVFVLFSGIFCMFCTHRVIALYSTNRCFSLLVLYPTIYLTYYMSGMRQGMMISFFLGFMVKWMIEGKPVKYFVGCLFCGMIHSAGWLLLPLYFIKYIRIIHIYIILALSVVLGLFLWVAPASWLSAVNIGAFHFYDDIRKVNLMSGMEKGVLLIIVIVVWHSVPYTQRHVHEQILYKMYLFAATIDFTFISWGGMAPRFSEANRAVLIVLFSVLLKRSAKYRQLLLTFIMAYSTLIAVKNINSYVKQANYVNTNLFTYPYISVFDKEKVLMRGEDGERLMELEEKQAELSLYGL